MIFAPKDNKISEFYIIFARKILFPDFFFWGGGHARAPLCPRLLRLWTPRENVRRRSVNTSHYARTDSVAEFAARYVM